MDGYLTIGYRYPTDVELERILSSEHGVHVFRMPEGEHSLDFLTPAAQGIHKLVVTDWNCHDARAVSEFTNLEELSLGTTDPRWTVDFTGLTKLRWLGARSSKHYASALELTGLRHVVLDRPSDEYLDQLRSTPTGVELASARRVSRIPDRREWDALEEFSLHQAQSFDVGSLRRESGIKGLEFDSVRELTDFGAIADLAGLEWITLENCGVVDDPDVFAALADREVRIIGGKVPIDREFMETRFGAVPPTWRVAQKLDPARKQRRG